MNQMFKVGEYIVDSFYIYQITGIKQADKTGGELLLEYKPIWGSDKIFTATIPISGLKKSGTRKIFTESEAKEMMSNLKNDPGLAEYNPIAAKELIYGNTAKGISSVLNYYARTANKISRSDLDMVEQIIKHLSQEISMATRREAVSIQDEIEEVLGIGKNLTMS